MINSGMTPAMTGSLFNMPAMSQNFSLGSGIFPPTLPMQGSMGDMFAQNLQQQAWTQILGILANYKPMTFDLSAFENNNQNYSDEDTSNFSYDSKELKEKWEGKKPNLSDEFYNKVVQIAQRLNCDPNDLMGVMNSESGIKSDAVNKSSNATGLIQFMPKTAKSLGTTTSKLKAMSPEEQLVYVEKYLTQAKSNAGFKSDDKIGAGTLYTLVFLPARAGREVLAVKGEGNSYYESNRGLDKNGDGKITKDELAQRTRGFIA